MNKIYKALAFDNNVSVCVMDVRGVVDRAIKIHSLNENGARVLGGLLVCCAYMASGLKNPLGAVSITLKSKDGSAVASVSGDKSLCIRGFIDGEITDLDGGTITVVREDGYSRPFVGTCLINGNDISAAITEYFIQSEQIPTAAAVGVKTDKNGACKLAGATFLQLLPDAPEEAVKWAVEQAEKYENICAALQDGVDKIWENFAPTVSAQTVSLTHPDYICNCSRAKIAGIITAMGKDDVHALLRERGKVSVHCHYCNTDYDFYEKDIDELFGD